MKTRILPILLLALLLALVLCGCPSGDSSDMPDRSADVQEPPEAETPVLTLAAVFSSPFWSIFSSCFVFLSSCDLTHSVADLFYSICREHTVLAVILLRQLTCVSVYENSSSRSVKGRKPLPRKSRDDTCQYVA